MKRLLPLSLLVCLVAPATAAAMRGVPGDGTLTVRNGSGTLNLVLTRGAVIGRLENGILDVITTDGNCSALDVWGADLATERSLERLDGSEYVVCRFVERARGGTPAAIRFRIDQPKTTVRIVRGVAFSVAAVGRGFGFIRGTGGPDDGVYAANGDELASLPDELTRFRLGTLVP